MKEKYMLPVHVQDLFGGNVINFKGKLYTVIEVSRSFRASHHCCLKARGINDRELLNRVLPFDFIVMKKTVEPMTRRKAS
jgi:translation elongation factor P/translation initiation factor 5A